MISNAEKVMTSMGSQPDPGLSVTLEDKYLRMMLIEVSMILEKAVKEGKYDLDKTITKTTPFGLEIVGSMTRPREDKPIVFKYQYRVNRADFQRWMTEHAYLMGGNCLGFRNMGIQIMIPGPGTERYHKTSFTVVSQYAEDIDSELSLDLLNQTATFVVHREVISEHDWIVNALPT